MVAPVHRPILGEKHDHFWLAAACSWAASGAGISRQVNVAHTTFPVSLSVV
jgi:hypothetical protein